MLYSSIIELFTELDNQKFLSLAVLIVIQSHSKNEATKSTKNKRIPLCFLAGGSFFLYLVLPWRLQLHFWAIARHHIARCFPFWLVLPFFHQRPKLKNALMCFLWHKKTARQILPERFIFCILDSLVNAIFYC